MTASTPAPSSRDIAAAVAALRAGDVIGLPTETVYGLAADAANPEAVRRIFAIKGRPASHPVIVHIADVDAVHRWARDFPPAAQALAHRFWPGPLTLVLPRAASVPLVVTGGQDTVALRVPAHPVALQVLRMFGGGLAAPSANRYGRISPTTAAHVRDDLGDDVALVLDGGPSDVGVESTIVSCLDGKVCLLRPGRISREELEGVVGRLDARPDEAPRVPGSVRSHYAPRTPVVLVDATDLEASVTRSARAGRTVAVLSPSRPAEAPGSLLLWIEAASDPHRFGRELYQHLRTLDTAHASAILIVRPPVGQGWDAIHDRLTRAAARDA